MNMEILEFVTPPSIYHACYTQKMFLEENFIGEESSILGEFIAVNMKNCSRRDIRKHRDIKSNDKYDTLEISLKFDSLDKIRITSLE